MVTPDSPSLQLLMQRGPAPGYAYPLAGNIVTVGRASDNSVVVADPQISRYHARLTWQAGGWVVEDLGSGNGTFVNEQRITSPTWLRPGDTLRLGDTIVFSTQSPPSGEATLAGRRPPAPTGRRRWPLIVLGVGGLLVLLLAMAALVLFLLRPSQPPTPPSVVLQRPLHGSHVALGEPTLIAGIARDPRRIVRVELWADGQLIATRRSDRPEGINPFPFFPDWTPSSLDQHVLFARAYTSDGRVGQSNVLALLAEERDKSPAIVEHQVTEGETLADIAENAGTDSDTLADLNPDLPPGEEPAPGDTLLVPDPEEAPTDGEPELPVEEPPEELGPLGGMSAPAGLMGTDEGCAVRLTWADAGDESGYRIYGRAPAGAVFNLLAGVGANTTEYLFPVAVPGPWGFYVVAFDGGGTELASPPLGVLVAPGPGCPSPVANTLAFDALRLSAPMAYGQIYCYASLASAPFERVPLTDGDFVVRAGDGLLHIEDYMAGPEARHLAWHEGTPLPVEFDCWGWAGVDLNWLGHFRNEHPPEEWDGRELTGSGDNVTLVYTINRVPAPGDAPHTDPSLEPPYNVRLNGGLAECMGTVFRSKAVALADLIACLSNPSIAWDWPYDESHIHGFRVIMRRWAPGFPGSATNTVLAEISDPGSRGAFIPPLPTGCGEAVEYRVVAFIYGRQSPLSPDSTGLENDPCPAGVAVTWETVTPHNLFDGGGDTTVEGYGWLMVNGTIKDWNHPTGPYTPVSPEVAYNWADQHLDGALHNNVTMYYPIGEGEDLTLDVSLRDYDLWSPDDPWCQGSFPLPARSASEWAAINETVVIEGTGHFGQSCTVIARVGGVMLPPPAVASQGNLHLLALHRASDGSLSLSLRSYGPDFLLGQTVRLTFDYDRSRTEGAITTTESVTFPAEEMSVTLPVNIATSLPLPFSAEDGWTTTVRVGVEPVTFVDPDPANNEVETTFFLE